ncbi:MAG: Gfo/Idh/MocA family protein, partial [Spirochaetales bacterium]
RVAAVGSRSGEKAEAFGEKFAIPNRHGSYEALVADPTVDIVYVATPHPMHCENALLAIEAGKHVLVEKAFTMSAAEARQVVNAAGKQRRFVMEAMWTRFLPVMDRVMELIRAGAIGEPRVLFADHNQYIPYEKAPRVHEPELGGGSVLDLGIYPYSFASRIFGKPKTITARATLSPLGVDELTSTIFEYDSGAQAVSQIGFLTPGPNTASVIGTDGRIDIDRVWYTQTGFTHYDRGGKLIERYEEKIDGRGMQYQALEVERCIREGIPESPIMPLGETIELMETMDEILGRIGVTYPKR